ncbi:hypothetical protein B7463_g10730, partial [Scytalidium lignicola]
MSDKAALGKPAQGMGVESGAQEEPPSSSKDQDHEAPQPSSPPRATQAETSITVPAPMMMRMPEISDMVERFSMQSIEHSARGTFLHHDALPSLPSAEDWERKMLYRTQYYMSRHDSHDHNHHGHHHAHHQHHHDGTSAYSQEGAPILDRLPLSGPPSSAGSSRLRYPTVSCRRTQHQLQTQLQHDGASVREIRSMVSEIVHNRRIHRASYSYTRSRSRLSSNSLPISATTAAAAAPSPSRTPAPPHRTEKSVHNGDIPAEQALILDDPESMEVDPEFLNLSPEPLSPFLDDDYAELHEWDPNPMPFSVDEETMRLGTFLNHQAGSSDADDPEFGLGLRRSTVPASIRKYTIRYRGCAECVGGVANKVRCVPRMRKRRLQQIQQQEVQQTPTRPRRMSRLSEVVGDGG